MHQQRIDFTRSEKLGLIRQANIPPATIPEGQQRRTVRPADLKGMLRAIDDFAGRSPRCWPTIDTLATATGLSARDVKRTLRGLKTLDLIAVAPRGRSNSYAIVWTELRRLSGAEKRAQTTGAQTPTTGAQIGATGAQIGLTGAHSGPTNCEALKRAPPTPPQPAPDPAAAPDPDSGVGGGSLQQIETRPAPDPAATPDTPATPDTQWSRVEASLRANGLNMSGRLIRRAQRRGLTPDDVAEAIATYRANRHKFASAGAIAVWIDEGAWPADDVRPSAEIEAQKARRHQTLQAKRDEIQQARDRHQADRAELERLERTYGEQLDRMDRGELDQLAHQWLTDRQRKLLDFRPQSMRPALLAAIDKRNHQGAFHG